ncbi:MAG: M23 family metallopeptidase [Flavobacteriaceae bacterium]
MKGDIGTEPALAFDNGPGEAPPQRWAYSLRWLACTLLAGVAGGALVSGALVTAFDGEYNFARAAGTNGGEIAEAGEPAAGASGKQDKIVTVARDFATRQIIHENFVRTVDGKELITVRPYVRITASLEPSAAAYASQIPPFNPIKLFAEAANEEAAPNLDDKFVTVQETDFYPGGPYEEHAVMSVDEVRAAVRELADFTPASIEYAGSGDGIPGSGDAVVGSGDESFAGLGMIAATVDGQASVSPQLPEGAAGDRANPESGVLFLAKKRAPTPVQDGVPVTVTVERGDTLMAILMESGASREEAMNAVSSLSGKIDPAAIAEGTVIDMVIAPDAEGRERPVRIAVAGEAGAILETDGSFVPESGNLEPLLLRSSASAAPAGPRAKLYDSVYATALKHGIPRELVDDLVRIISFDVDYQRPMQPGDSLEVFYNEPQTDGIDAQEPEILYASITSRGETHRFFRFRTPDDGFIDYYDPSGHSAKKFLMRKPMNGGRFRSGFGMRQHPILKYKRMHNGVDWAAPTGTPIFASGNGTIIKSAWTSGYGKYVEIRHANGYATGYGHMSAIAKGMDEGVKVRQGQVIGYVGSTGLSTGPHLHYEVRVNGRLVDPLRIRLPRGRVLNGRMLTSYERERARIEALMNRAPASTRIAGVGG